MKKRRATRMAALALLCLALTGLVALAGSVYSRTLVTLGAATGTATWENDRPYAAIELKRIWIQNNLNATGVVTVTRITKDGLYTQTVGSVTCTDNAGSTASFTAGYLLPGDELAFVNAPTTGAVAMVEYEVQQH